MNILDEERIETFLSINRSLYPGHIDEAFQNIADYMKTEGATVSPDVIAEVPTADAASLFLPCRQ